MDYKRKVGKFIFYATIYKESALCSCGYVADKWTIYNVCPCCGKSASKMRQAAIRRVAKVKRGLFSIFSKVEHKAQISGEPFPFSCTNPQHRLIVLMGGTCDCFAGTWERIPLGKKI